MDGSRSMLIMTILVGPPEIQVSDVRIGKLCQKRLLRFQYFTVVILTSFLSLPSHSTGELKHFGTIDTSEMPDSAKEILDSTAKGVKPSEAYRLHMTLFQMLSERAFVLISHREKLDGKLGFGDLRVLSKGNYTKSNLQKAPSVQEIVTDDESKIKMFLSSNFQWV